eukprot:scaffold4357_cov113-Isochrysis_galbana.AAC.8
MTTPAANAYTVRPRLLSVYSPAFAGRWREQREGGCVGRLSEEAGRRSLQRRPFVLRQQLLLYGYVSTRGPAGCARSLVVGQRARKTNAIGDALHIIYSSSARGYRRHFDYDRVGTEVSLSIRSASGRPSRRRAHRTAHPPRRGAAIPNRAQCQPLHVLSSVKAGCRPWSGSISGGVSFGGGGSWSCTLNAAAAKLTAANAPHTATVTLQKPTKPLSGRQTQEQPGGPPEPGSVQAPFCRMVQSDSRLKAA